MKQAIFIAIVLCAWSMPVAAEDLDNLSANLFLYESTANPFGKGSPSRRTASTIASAPTVAPSAIHQPRIPLRPTPRGSTTSRATIEGS